MTPAPCQRGSEARSGRHNQPYTHEEAEECKRPWHSPSIIQKDRRPCSTFLTLVFGFVLALNLSHNEDGNI